ncbi:hypothetical protein ASPSYDRAFT_140912 [Aspergillus sydowii CBS 593.65]|uniref:Uncharacterized protein n=1 Tax=Aspergillus sydowii CBS 593.65 TaxID=1036612 RepID=A0A1L9TY48_9EURO|nr:uncharacterized protein ASPSYDRAFT_140912 [Aspergillus sydowii CBS 593.65]OJJ64203.1 hypothetical protein ASPSYDRAFT_140912 [Aspergillus sydowii CBS 593.65]
MALSNSAVIVIVIVACLFAVTVAAALFRQYSPAEHNAYRGFSREQEVYMRSVRLKNLGFNYRESQTPMPRDVESASTSCPELLDWILEYN